MPSGKTHAFMTGTLGAMSVFIPFDSISYTVLFSYGCFMGLFVYPDLDVDIGNYGFYLIRTVFGEKISKVWQFYWYPYSKIIPHRGFISHFPVVSTIIRLVYLMLPLYLVFETLSINMIEYEMLYVVAGLVLVDSVHIVSDVVVTFFRRKF